jgi:DivIVA domain-containing protein
VALDRQSIEKKDFPTARQGYDKAAVDAHLATIADQFEHLSLASSASDRVRAIVEAAETSAAEIQREADDAARATRQEAEQAARHAREGAGKLSELAAALTRQLDESRQQLEALVGSLPGATQGAVGEPLPRTEARVYSDPVDAEPSQAGPASQVAAPDVSAPPDRPPEVAAPPDRPPEVPAPTAPPDPAPEPPTGSTDPPPAPISPAAGSEESENARLIALNMALDGVSREQAAKYLEENFQLADRDRLLDEVYASVEG